MKQPSPQTSRTGELPVKGGGPCPQQLLCAGVAQGWHKRCSKHSGLNRKRAAWSKQSAWELNRRRPKKCQSDHKPASSSCEHDQTGGVQWLMTLGRTFCQLCAGSKDMKSTKDKSLPLFLQYLASALRKYESSSSVVPVTEHTSAGDRASWRQLIPPLGKPQRRSDEGFWATWAK